jgi:hypothetical protein
VVCRIGRENESADVIPQQKEDVVRTRNAGRGRGAVAGGPPLEPRLIEKTLISP